MNYNYLLSTTDARKWAEAFCQLCPDMDEGTMIAWFANAIETGKAHSTAEGEDSSGEEP